MAPPDSTKAELRRRLRAWRDAIPPDQRAAWSAEICRRAAALPAFQSARVAHCFLSIQSEVDTRALVERALADGKRVAIPVFVKGSDETPCAEIDSLSGAGFEPGRFGLSVPKAIRPVAPDEIDLAFVPLLAFAARRTGREAGREPERGWDRLGYGVGYYDRFLARVRPSAPRIGLAFAGQEVEALPAGPRDAPLDAVITEAGEVVWR
jgi:5-formyltetrahydrofolate cyclo-ligase